MPTRTVVAVLSELSAVGVLAGCAAGTSAPVEPVTDAPAEAPADDTSADAALADGTYTADGAYVAPSGPESVTVTLTLADGVVTAVEVVGHATDPQARSHQADFAGGVAAVVVGKPLEGLAVDRVAGSSLTGAGFNAALDAIRADAGA